MNDKTGAETTRKPARPNLPLIAWAALPLTVGLVFAQQSSAGTTQNQTQDQAQRVQPAQPGQRSAQPNQQGSTQPGQQNQGQQNQAQRQGTGANYADVFLQKLAAQLGITLDRLKAAATAAATATIDQGVKAGDFTADQATFMKQNAAQNPFAMTGGRGGPGGRGGHDHGGMGQMDGGLRLGGGPAVTGAVAQALTEQQLFTELQAGKTIEQLAQAKGVSTTSLHNAAVTALKTSLAAEVTAGRLTQAQADQMIAQAQADATFGLNLGGRGFGRGGPDGDRDGMGRGGFGGSRSDDPTQDSATDTQTSFSTDSGTI